MIETPTRIATRCEKVDGTTRSITSTSLIDHIYTSIPREHLTINNIPFGGSDHHLVYLVYKKHKLTVERKILEFRCFRKINKESFEQDINNIDWSFLNDPREVNESVRKFENSILNILDKHAPLKRKAIKGTNVPWFNSEILQMCKDRDAAKKEACKSKTEFDWKCYTKLRNAINSKLRSAKREYFRKKFSSVSDSSSIWTLMDELISFKLKKSVPLRKLITNQGDVLETDEDICEQFSKEFIVNAAECDVTDMKEEIDNYCKNYVEDPDNFRKFDEVISEGEVLAAISKVKKGATSQLHIPRRVFKEFPFALAKPLTTLFNLIWITTFIPQCFKSADVLPLYKGKGKKCSSSSYRAIFCLTFLTKVFERILYNRISGAVDKQLDDNQHGFRRGRSCDTATTKFSHEIYDGFNITKGKVLAVYIDFSKAFDSVSQDLLLKKFMYKFSLAPKLIQITHSFFTSRIFCVKNGDFKSKYYQIRSGVPPGSCTGSLFYSLYVNDIKEAINLDYIMYADDCVIYLKCTDIVDGVKIMNECLVKLSEWCSQNKLKINVGKTKAMIFHKPKDISLKSVVLPKVLLDSEEVEYVNVFKYLGMNFDSTMSFKQHMESVEVKVNAALSKMYTLKRMFSENVLKTFMSAFISSITDYGIVTWSIQSNLEINKIQNKITRFLRSYYYPRTVKKDRKNKKKQSNNFYKSHDCNELLNRVDLLSIIERRRLMLIKFAYKNIVMNGLFKEWFTRIKKENCYGFPRLVVPKYKAEKCKDSVIRCATIEWNALCGKIIWDSEMGYHGFIDKVKCLIKNERII
jgi:hypothetical protein